MPRAYRRLQVLKRLGEAMEEHPAFFEGEGGIFRPGNMVDCLLNQADPLTKVGPQTFCFFFVGAESSFR